MRGSTRYIGSCFTIFFLYYRLGVDEELIDSLILNSDFNKKCQFTADSCHETTRLYPCLRMSKLCLIRVYILLSKRKAAIASLLHRR